MTDWFTWLVGVVALAAAAVIGWGIWSLVKLREFRVAEQDRERIREDRERIRESMRAKRPMWHAPDPHHPTEETRK